MLYTSAFKVIDEYSIENSASSSRAIDLSDLTFSMESLLSGEKKGADKGDTFDPSEIRLNIGPINVDPMPGVGGDEEEERGEHVVGDRNDNELTGTELGENFYSRNGDDVINALGGDDRIFADGGSDIIDGGEGEDIVTFQRLDERVVLDLGDSTNSTSKAWGDTYISIERFFMTDFDDRVFGSDGDDYFRTLDGDDTVSGGNGRDKIFAGEGDDTVFGGGKRDYLVGMEGNDVLDGGHGHDRIEGGTGDDILTGGAGKDEFFFQASAEENWGNDVITDFDANGDDVITIDVANNLLDGLLGMTALDDIGSLIGLEIQSTVGGTLLSWGENSITLLDTEAENVGVDDFLFI